MLRQLIAFVGGVITLGGGILATIALVGRLDAPALVLPAVVVIISATLGVCWLCAPAGSAEDKRRWLSRMLAQTPAEPT